MGVQYSVTDLQGKRFEAKEIDNRGSSSAGLRSFFAILFDSTADTILSKSLTTTTTRVLVALIVSTVLLGMIMYLSGAGTGPGTICSVFVLTLTAIIFLIGTVAGATKATLGCQ